MYKQTLYKIIEPIKPQVIKRLNRQIKAMSKGYLPWAFNGYISTLPVDVLIDEKGVVTRVKYAKDFVYTENINTDNAGKKS